jgi:predicted Zn-dependent protease
MKKVTIEFFALIILFFGLLFILNSINWMKLFHVEKVTKETETKLGEICWKTFSNDDEVIKNNEVLITIDSLLSKICKSNAIDYKKIKIHVVKNDEINAFALPGNHLIIYTGLIKAVKNESELSGVICHEIAHIESDHVMKKLISEIGLTAIITATNTNTSGEVLKKIAKTLSASAYSRNLETEADLKAADYLIKAQLDPLSFANFFNEIDSIPNKKILQWINSHPDSKERTLAIKKYVATKKLIYTPILSKSSFNKMQSILK